MKNNFKSIYLKSLRDSASKKPKIKQELIKLIKEIDCIELLCHISLLNALTPQPVFDNSYDKVNKDLKVFKENPSVQFLTGLALKYEDFNGRQLQEDDIEKVITLINEYMFSSRNHLILKSSDKDNVTEKDGIILFSRLQKIIGQINPNMYPHQIEQLINDVFQKFEKHFFNTYGFTPKDALNFGKQIIERYDNLVRKRKEETLKSKEKMRKELEQSKKGEEIRKMFKESYATMNDEEILEIYFAFIFFFYPQEIFLFTIEDFCKEENIKSIDNFKNYLKTLSCKFGENNEYDSVLDDNIILTRPIINLDDRYYFSPSFLDLTGRLPLILETLLEPEKLNQTKLWQKYQKNVKSKFTEDKTCEFLSRIIPNDLINRNLSYSYMGKEREADVLFKYDNKIFIVEIKSGRFSQAAQRGALKRLQSDLKKLIEEAYEQSKVAENYIKSTEKAIFKNKKNEEIIINFDKTMDSFILINVTLEPLMALSTGLKKLQSLGLFQENEYPWSVNLFELDVITNHIESPGAFIHFLESRLKALDKDAFFGLDELDFLAYYLSIGNLFTPLTKDGKAFDTVLFDNTLVLDFDKHYLLGRESPTLRIESEWKKIINLLENFPNNMGHTNVISALLDVPHESRKRMIKGFKSITHKTMKDRKEHDYTEYLDSVLDTGYTFMTHTGRRDFLKKFEGYSTLKKYQCNAKRWVSIGFIVSGYKWSISNIYYQRGHLKKDPRLDALVKKNLGKPGKTFD